MKEWHVYTFMLLVGIAVALYLTTPTEADDTGPWQLEIGPRGKHAAVVNTETGQVYTSLVKTWDNPAGSVWKKGDFFE